MSELSDKLAYARGLFEGMNLKADSPECRLIQALLDALQSASGELNELRKAHEDLSEYVDVLDDDISELESEIYGDFDEDDDGEDDDDADEDDEDEEDDEEDDDDDVEYGDDIDDECDCDCDCGHEHCDHEHGQVMLDKALLERDCPNCGHKIGITLRMLCHRDQPIVCPNCGCKFIAADADE